MTFPKEVRVIVRDATGRKIRGRLDLHSRGVTIERGSWLSWATVGYATWTSAGEVSFDDENDRALAEVFPKLLYELARELRVELATVNARMKRLQSAFDDPPPIVAYSTKTGVFR